MYAHNPNVTTFAVGRNLTSDQMKQVISQGPIGVLIYANTGFQQYKSGIYTGCPNFVTSYSKINHAVVIVGYDVNGNYIVKNSWGTNWGQNGFGVVSKDADCGISAMVYQYQSSAASGTGVVYNNQVNLESSSSGYALRWMMMLIMVLMMALVNWNDQLKMIIINWFWIIWSFRAYNFIYIEFFK